jgi:hypothetical protein
MSTKGSGREHEGYTSFNIGVSRRNEDLEGHEVFLIKVIRVLRIFVSFMMYLRWKQQLHSSRKCLRALGQARIGRE